MVYALKIMNICDEDCHLLQARKRSKIINDVTTINRQINTK